MNKNLAAIAAAAALGVALLTGCGTEDRDCDSTTVMFFGTDGAYHYGSPKGKTVPANKVPSSARKVPGYKAPAAPKGSYKAPKSGGGYKAPARSGRR